MIKPNRKVTCNYCGLFNTKPYVVKYGLTIVQCKNCGLLYVNPQFKEHDLLKIYGQDYFQSGNPLICGYKNYLKEQKNIEQGAKYYLDIIQKFTDLKQAKLLEVGCAFGFFLNTAQKRGVDVWGIEISDFAAKIARKNFKLRVYTGRFPEIKLPRDFDIVVMWDTLEHVNDPLTFLKKCFQVLKPGGLLFLSVPDAGSIFARIMGKRWLGFQKIHEHNYFFSFSTLSKLLEKAGFEIIEKRRSALFCNLGFVGEKLKQYSQTLGETLIGFLKITRLSDWSVNLGFIDMFIISKKNETT